MKARMMNLTVVDLFQEGKTVETGIFDMSGNVSEWTNSLWAKDDQGRVIRGGSEENILQDHSMLASTPSYFSQPSPHQF